MIVGFHDCNCKYLWSWSKYFVLGRKVRTTACGTRNLPVGFRRETGASIANAVWFRQRAGIRYVARYGSGKRTFLVANNLRRCAPTSSCQIGYRCTPALGKASAPAGYSARQRRGCRLLLFSLPLSLTQSYILRTYSKLPRQPMGLVVSCWLSCPSTVSHGSGSRRHSTTLPDHRHR